MTDAEKIEALKAQVKDARCALSSIYETLRKPLQRRHYSYDDNFYTPCQNACSTAAAALRELKQGEIK